MNDLRYKFRFWNGRQMSEIIPFGCDLYDINAIEKANMPIMQCIGEKDRNGKPIFEGDVVNAWFKNEYGNDQYDTYTVVYDDRIMGFAFKYKVHNEPICDIWSDEAFNSIDYEVIGNIYENPELAEGDK